MNKTRTRPWPKPNNYRLLCKARTCSLLAYRAIRACIRKRDIWERDIGERDNWERDIEECDIGERDIRERDISEREIRETVDTCWFNQQLLIHIHIRCVSGCHSFSQSWRRQARFSRRHIPHMLQPTVGMALGSSWWCARIPDLWQWGRRRRLWPLW